MSVSWSGGLPGSGLGGGRLLAGADSLSSEAADGAAVVDLPDHLFQPGRAVFLDVLGAHDGKQLADALVSSSAPSVSRG